MACAGTMRQISLAVPRLRLKPTGHACLPWHRLRWANGIRQSVAAFAERERLSALPAPFPAVLTVSRTVSPQALMASTAISTPSRRPLRPGGHV
jgi:hypothetical protein